MTDKTKCRLWWTLVDAVVFATVFWVVDHL